MNNLHEKSALDLGELLGSLGLWLRFLLIGVTLYLLGRFFLSFADAGPVLFFRAALRHGIAALWRLLVG